TRLKSMKTSFALGVAVVLLVSAASVIGLIVRRGSQTPNLPPQPLVNQSVVGSDVSVPSNVEDTSSSATAVAPPVPEAPIANDKRLRKVTRQTRPVTSTPAEEPVQTVERREVPAAPPVTVATPKPEPRKPAVSPQLISPTTNAPKAKVIQWP
ncbi:MAG TPA: hypothetical protein VFP64_12575, partial [Pyrinomonadaceae bacterium]|nr:hypothetical protein [Pyrinomonadaceae bacterium]